jgi:peroxiredoxin
LRDVIDDIRGHGAELVVVGNGNAAQAAAFRDEHGLDFPLLTDPSRRTYRTAGLRRSIGATLNPVLLKNAGRAFKKGFRQTGVKGDAWQQGGVFVIDAGGEVVFEQRSKAAGDHADPDAILAALAKIA